ncbi:SMP-30/gluconolactonase/LRE family protein [soil metagenome]
MKKCFHLIVTSFPKKIWVCLLLISVKLTAQEIDTSITMLAEPILISAQFSFTEGPAADKAGNVFFTDQPNNKIWKFDTKGKISLFAENAGRANGMYFDASGNLITCSDEKNQLLSINPEGKISVLVNDFKGHQLNGPNDCWIDKKGGVYFTDPYYQRDYWERKNPDTALGGQKVYYLAKKSKKAIVAAEDFKKPNGIVGTSNGKNIFVSDIGAGKIYKYTIGADGSLSDRQLFVQNLADGMTTDNTGNLYLAGNGVTIYTASGIKLQHIDVPAKWTANICFGGSDHDILFITASESVFIMPMKVKGSN